MDRAPPPRSPRDAVARDLLGPGHGPRETPPRPGLAAAALLALLGALAAAGQAASVAVTGEEVCLGAGCAVVGKLTRISPALFNAVGAAVFAAAAALAWWAHRLDPRRSDGALAALRLLLAGSLAAEGVLVGYQWHVAQAWCTYCLGLLALLVALNALAGSRSLLFGAAGFGAVLTVFSLLSFVPQAKTLEHGTLAVRGPADAPELILLFSEHCPHCQRVLTALEDAPRCSVRYNPVGPLPPEFLPGLPRNPSFDPTVNLATARLLGLRTVPLLVVRDGGSVRVLAGEGAILRQIAETCAEPSAAPSLLGPSSAPSLLAPHEDGCGLGIPACD